MNEKIRSQLLKIRATGEVNMFEARQVQALAYEHDFFELVDFIEEHEKEYGHFILTGCFEEEG